MKKVRYVGKFGAFSWKDYTFEAGEAKLINDEDAEVLLKKFEGFEQVGKAEEKKVAEEKKEEKKSSRERGKKSKG